MQQERQISNTLVFTPAPYSVRQRFLSASLSLAMTGTMTISMASAHTTATGWNAAAPTTPIHNAVAHVVAPMSHTTSTPALHAVQPATTQLHSSSTTTTSTPAQTHTHTSSSSGGTTALTFHHANANTPVTTPAKNDLDLNSAAALFSAGTIANFTSVSIVVGGKTEQVNLNTKLTAAELLATQQVLSGQKQTIDISKTGAAVGGTFNVNANSFAQLDSDLGGSIGALYIPHGVKLVDTVGTLNLNGKLTNYGSIVTGGTTGKSIETIDAASIINASGAKITTGSSLATNSLTLDTSSLTNQGTISSSGALNIKAPTVINSGTLSSAHGNVNFLSTQNIALNNSGGTVQAKSGDINFRTDDYSGSSNTTISGGALNSQNVNINGGNGAVNANVDSVTGRINTVADTAHITAASGNLILGNQNIKNDPTYYNTNGNVTINGTITTNGNDLAIVASGNIVTGNFTNEGINTSSQTGNGGNVLLIAGANFTSDSGSSTGTNDTTSTLTLTNSQNAGNGSATGGYIDLSGLYAAKGTSAPLTTFTTSSSTGTAGSIEAVAYHGTAAHSGSVIFGGPNSDTQLMGATNAQNNDLSIIADGGNSAAAPGLIQLGNVEANNIYLIAATPILFGSMTIQNGSITSGEFFANPQTASQNAVQFTTLTGTNVTISTANKVTGSSGTSPAINVAGNGGTGANVVQGASDGGNGGSVTINAGTGITLNAVDASGGGGGGGAAGSFGNGGGGGSGGAITLTTTTGNIQTLGALNVSGGGGGGAAGDTNTTFTPGSGGDAGDVVLKAGGALLIGAPIYAITGASGTNGALPNNGGAGGGSYGGGGGGGSAAAGNTDPVNLGGGGGGGTYGGGGGGSNVGDPFSPAGGSGGSPATLAGGAGGLNGNGGAASPGTAGAGGDAVIIGQLGGLGGTAVGQSGSDASGNVGAAASTSISTGGVNLQFGAASYAGTATAKQPITIDASGLTLTATANNASITVKNDTGIGDMTLNGGVPLGTLTLNAAGGSLAVQNVSAGVLNLTAANAMNVSENLVATTSASLSAQTIQTVGAGQINAPTLALQASAAGPSIDAQVSSNSISVQATGTGAIVNLTEEISTAGATSILASNIGNNSGAGTFSLHSSQQVNLNGAINTNGSASSNGNLSVFETGTSAVGIAINSAQTVVGGSGIIDLSTSLNQNITDTTAKVLQASSVVLANGNAGTASAPIVTNESTGISGSSSSGSLTLDSTGGQSVFIRDTTTGALLITGSGTPSNNLTLTSTSSALTLETVQFANVTITDTAKGGTITLGSADGTIGGAVGSGAGAVSLTANGSILATNLATQDLISGTKVTLVSTAGSIGDIAGAGGVSVSAPILSATASTGSVDVAEQIAATIGGAASMSGTNTFYATSLAAITTSGTISGANVHLDSDSSSLTLGGNVNAATTNVANTSTVYLAGGNINQTSATSKVTGGTITFNALGGIGSASPFNTAASSTVVVEEAGVASIKQTGAVTLDSSEASSLTFSSTGAIKLTGANTFSQLNLNSTGALTLGDGTNAGSIDLNNTNGVTILNSTTGITIANNFTVNGAVALLNAGNGTIAVNGSIAPDLVTSFTATGTSSLSITGSGTITPGHSIELTAGGAITLSTGTTNASLLTSLESTSLSGIQIQAGTTFTSPLNSLTSGVDNGTVSLQAASIVYNGTGTPSVFNISAGFNNAPGSITLNLTGPSNITLDSTASALVKNTFTTFDVQTANGIANGGGTISVSTAGTLNVPSTNGFTLGTTLTLQGGTGLQITGSINNQDNQNNYQSVTLISNSKLPFLVGGTTGTTFNGISGTLTAFNPSITDIAGIKIGEALVAQTISGGLNFTTSNFSFASGGSINAGEGALQILNPNGAITIANGNSSNNYQEIGFLDIEAQRGAVTIADSNLLSLASTSAMTPMSEVRIISSGALTLPTATTNLYATNSVIVNAGSTNFQPGFSLDSYGASSSGSVVFNTTSPIVVGATGVNIAVCAPNQNTANGNVQVTSSGNLTVDGNSIFFGTSTIGQNLNLGGTNLSLTNLTGHYEIFQITSNSATPFTIGATTAAQQKNGIQLASGSLSEGEIYLTNSGGSIVAGAGLTSPLTATTNMSLTDKTGITGISATSNLQIQAGVLEISSASGTVNLETTGTNATDIIAANAGATGTLNLQADNHIVFSLNSALTASAINLTTGTGGEYVSSSFDTSAKTISGFRNNLNFGDNSSLTINDTNTGITTIGTFAGTGTNDSSNLSITTAGAIAVNGSLSNLASTTLTAGGATGNIAIATGGKFMDTASSDTVTLDTAGTGVVSNAAGTTTTIQATTLFITNGNGAVPTTALRVDAPNLTVEGSGGFNILQQTSTASEIISVTSIGPIKSLQYSGVTTGMGSVSELDFGGMATTNGSLSLSGNAANLDINGNQTTTAGSISILNTDLTGNITVAPSVTIYGSGTAPGVGQVTIAIGTTLPPAATLSPGAIPNNLTVVAENGGKFTFGTTAFPFGTITANGGTSTATANGRNLVFSEGNGKITLDGSDTIIADPPVGAALTIMQPVSSISSSLSSPTSTPKTLTEYSASASSEAQANVVTAPATSFTPAPSLSVSQTNISTSAPLEIFTNPLNVESPASITTTQTPALVVNSQPAGSNNDIETKINASTSVVEKLTSLNNTLVGGVSNNSRLDDGVTLIAADRNQVLQTGFGSVGIAKDALVLAIAFDHGIAVYNLHDSKRGAVTVNYRNHNIVLASGQHALLTEKDVKYFEQINPISYVGYRNLNAQDLGDGVKAFHAEFDIYSLIKGLEPLQQMFSSSEPQNRKIALSALKTAALITTMANGSKQFELMNMAPTTAMAVDAIGR